jgi:hypothetical protein
LAIGRSAASKLVIGGNNYVIIDLVQIKEGLHRVNGNHQGICW